ncbi:MAG: ammonium transporter [Anaerobutyricum soehngenii]|uniref:Ammonium transporter n=1 Tax=Anaerobutyricum soehngenii TaxID=105843 RepID=A0A6N7YD48_9FIRM|nr:ammonium transporter [Anaerobutyricum soehngenii]MDY5243972.1 ammonium transporter [Anaerobutyricum soehngenii]MSU82353.1 ammonium transporter [Anaerobutyricum soehngenii]
MDMSVWYLLGAVLVFFMQCGFAMVETGFTRAKNAGNIIMKNLMDFCIGTVVFFVLGYGIMNSENYFFGLIGRPEYQMFTDFANFDWSNFFFQLVFCATAATIVSGAMAERTKFSTYCIYSAVISAIVYPIEAGWVWNSAGWLAKLGYVDFAGSSVIHMVGGIASVIGAAMLGPRIGKYTKGKDGKVVVNAFPGHSLTLGALGCFILWFAWYGFNGAAASDPAQLAQILGTTTIAPAVATFACMLFTWIRNGAPDVSMCLNASLAGLVGITAGCANVDAVGATIIGLVDGILVVIVVEFIDQKLKIDDPVGAVAVHGCNGLWGTVAVGLFDYNNGVFYGGGFHQLGVQVLGVVCIAAYTAVAMTIVFTILKHTIGLRVSAEEEIMGLDIAEHDLASAYADFLPISATTMGGVTTETIDVTDLRDKKLAPIIGGAKEAGGRYTKLTIMCKEDRFAILKDAMSQIGVTGMTVSHVMGCGTQKGKTGQYRGVKIDMNLLPQLQVDIVVSTVPPELVVEAAKKALYTGEYGDGKIFLYDVENVVRIRTNETGIAALDNDVAH